MGREYTPQELNALFDRFRARYPPSLLEDNWYTSAAAALTSSAQPSCCGQLYTYLTDLPTFQTPHQRQAMVRRLREALIKCIILVGIPGVIEALASVAAQEKEEDRDYSFLREHWQRDDGNRERAKETLEMVYRGEDRRILDVFRGHRDMVFISDEISYGLFLSEHTILSHLETELVVLPAIMCQNLKRETGWHLRGCVRAGVSRDDVELVHQAIEMVAETAGRRVDSVPRVRDMGD